MSAPTKPRRKPFPGEGGLRQTGQMFALALDVVRARLPEDPAADTERRADRGRELLDRYMALTGTDEDAALGDLLADLRHLANRDGYDYGLADARAESRHADEAAQQASGSWSARLREAGDNPRR